MYITEALRVLTENTAKFARGSMITEKYYDIINKRNTKHEQKDGNEIVRDIVTRAGLELV